MKETEGRFPIAPTEGGGEPYEGRNTLTLAHARRAIATWSDLSVDRRRGLASAVSSLARMAGRDEAAIELSCSVISGVLYAKPPAGYGMTPQRHGNVASALRDILRRFGRQAPKASGWAGLAPDWQELYDALQTEYRQHALVGFMAFCTLRGVASGSITDATLSAYEAWLESDVIDKDPTGAARRVASNWAWASTNVPGWPAVALHRQGMRDTYSLPLDAYPVSFRDDVDRYLDRLACTDLGALFPDEIEPAQQSGRHPMRARRKPSRPRTIDTRRWHIRHAAAALVNEGLNPDEITCLGDLFLPISRAKTILNFHYRRANGTPTSQSSGIAETLRQVATFHCKLDEADLDRIAVWSDRLKPEPRSEMTDKNMQRLLAMLEPRNRAMLLHPPARLTEQAQAPGLTAKAAARLMAYAVAMEILIVFPMRRSNLAGLHLDQHLVRLEPGSRRISHIFLSSSEMKGRKEMHWPLPPESAALLQLYIDKHRPHVAAQGNPFLFAGPGMVGRSAHELAIGLCDLIHRTIGIRINMHLMRHFAVALFLQANPEAYEVARQVLGHAHVSTTRTFYAGLEAESAARRFDGSVLQTRAEDRSRAAAVFGRPVGRPKAKRR